MTLATLAAAAALGGASGVHCIAMCGPLAIAGCSRRGGGVDRRAAIGYFAGRLASYAAGGAVAGVIGRPIVAHATSRELRLVVGIVLAATVAWAALRWLRDGSSPRLVALRRPARPSPVTAVLARVVPARGLGLGLATGAFPCGALAAGLLAAASSGSPSGGALAMIAFSLASAPSLLLALMLGQRTSRWLSARGRHARRAVGVVLLGVAGWLAVSPWLATRTGPPGCACDDR